MLLLALEFNCPAPLVHQKLGLVLAQHRTKEQSLVEVDVDQASDITNALVLLRRCSKHL